MTWILLELAPELRVPTPSSLAGHP